MCALTPSLTTSGVYYAYYTLCCSHSSPHAAPRHQQWQRKNRERSEGGGARATVGVSMRDETAALTAISLQVLIATSYALTTSLTTSGVCYAYYTLCCSHSSPHAAPQQQWQRKNRERSFAVPYYPNLVPPPLRPAVPSARAHVSHRSPCSPHGHAACIPDPRPGR